ncbi:MAG: GIY-YIG nuclease family protein [Ignavibacteriales bacterium]|nr:GIY-YIG nuclease family protein [Ignavibacteriales bacterium]
MYWVYVLWSEKLQKRYIGSTENPEIRLEQHNRGLSSFTNGGAPWMLIHKEPFNTRSEAYKRERFLKTGVGRKWLDEQLSEYIREQ